MPEDSFAAGVFPDKPAWVPAGITVPWFEGGEVVMVNVRRPDGSDPKYWAVRGSRRDGAYPSRAVVRAGSPLLLVEGEFETLLLNQELADLAPALTLGSAGDRPKPGVLDAMLRASPWLLAGDADAAGDKSAERWLALSARCRRARPPGPHKDWMEARQGGSTCAGGGATGSPASSGPRCSPGESSRPGGGARGSMTTPRRST